MRRLLIPVTLLLAVILFGSNTPAWTEGTMRSRAVPMPHKATATTLSSGTYDYTYGTSGDPLTNLVATWDNTADPSTLPWVVLVHGGTWSSGNNVDYETKMAAMFQKYGWATFNIDYRLIPNVSGATQEQDVLHAVQYVRAHYGSFKIDPTKGTLYGFSAGGHLAALVGLQYPGLVQDIVTASGVLQPQRLADDILGDNPEEPVDPTWGAYALSRMDEWTGCTYPCDWSAFEPVQTATSAPLWAISGSEDTIVYPAMTEAFGGIVAPGYGHDENEILTSTPNAQAMLRFVISKVHAGSW